MPTTTAAALEMRATAVDSVMIRTDAGYGDYFLPPKPLKRALKRSTRPAVSMMRCLPV